MQIEQIDRDAAAKLTGDEAMAYGMADLSDAVQAFARHRLAALSARPAGDYVLVREIETVTGDFCTEPGEPFYRIEIDGFCADFDYREAADNFAAAINARIAARPAVGEDVVERVLAKVHAVEKVNIMGRREVTLYFGDNDEAEENMEAFVSAAIAAMGVRDEPA
ncbi:MULTISPECIES: hypothetical protein [Sphingomonadales]|uniref:hypothetical protein n=1 Tax=Sphingomonadales TaxID=204457 RepID=UPI000826F8F7|nr:MULTISPECIES: hypothetical protein [Sphingomonadales]